MERTRILVDNTTLAAAGRAMYLGDFGTDGGMHADIYYRRFADARDEDVRSLAELLTALVLFDEVIWEGSSFGTQEDREMRNAVDWEKNAWVYAWFPLFAEAHHHGALEHFTTGHAQSRLEEAQRRAIDWVVHRVQAQTYQLPTKFRVPLAYSAADHHDRHNLVVTATESNLQLDPANVPLALFLSRGLYYQAAVFDEPGWSYMPHAFRAALLADADQQASSFLVSLAPRAADVVRMLDSVILARAAAVLPAAPSVLSGVAIGAGLLRCAYSPKQAFENALRFRNTAEGREVRDTMKELIALASAGQVPRASAILDDIDRDLRDVLLGRFGYAPRGDSRNQDQTGVLFSLMGVFRDVLRAAVEMLPTTARTSLTRVLYTSLTRPSGFQVLFRNYVDDSKFRGERRSA